MIENQYWHFADLISQLCNQCMMLISRQSNWQAFKRNIARAEKIPLCSKKFLWTMTKMKTPVQKTHGEPHIPFKTFVLDFELLISIRSYQQFIVNMIPYFLSTSCSHWFLPASMTCNMRSAYTTAYNCSLRYAIKHTALPTWNNCLLESWRVIG